MPSSAVALRSDKPLTPAMTSAVWEIAAALDEARVPAEVPNAVWLEVPTTRLRGPGARQDNIWLRECLERLTGVKLSGEYRGDPWGAVVLAEWRIEQGGSLARLLIPPAGVHALRSPANFTKIEEHAAHRLTGHGRRLYAILADKKRLGRPSWRFSVEELRALMGVDGQKSYDRWSDLRTRVIDPAVEAINVYGTVSVTMTPEKLGRAVQWVRFEWRWKDPHEAAAMAGEGSRQDEAQGKAQARAEPKAEPPMIPDEPQAEPALTWWGRLTDAERESWGDKAGRTFEAGGRVVPRREADLARAAHALFQASDDTQEPKLLQTPAWRRGRVRSALTPLPVPGGKQGP